MNDNILYSPLNSARSVSLSQRTNRSGDTLAKQRELLYAMASAEAAESAACMRELERFDERFRRMQATRPKLGDSSRRSLPLALPELVDLVANAKQAAGAPGSPRSPRQRNIATAFATIDANGNGSSSRAEMIKACRRDEEVRALLGLPSRIGEEQRAEFEAVFQAMDEDDSKDINFEEFSRYADALAQQR